MPPPSDGLPPNERLFLGREARVQELTRSSEAAAGDDHVPWGADGLTSSAAVSPHSGPAAAECRDSVAGLATLATKSNGGAYPCEFYFFFEQCFERPA